jgi:hypothetical protein
MLCYLRHPGRPLRTNERPPAALVSVVAEQIDVRPDAIGDYLASEQNRRRHAAEFAQARGVIRVPGGWLRRLSEGHRWTIQRMHRAPQPAAVFALGLGLGDPPPSGAPA